LSSAQDRQPQSAAEQAHSVGEGEEMGRRYSFQLFYPVDQVRAGLEALNPYLPTLRRKRSGQPIKGESRPGIWDLSRLSGDQPMFFELSLLFPADESVRGFRLDWKDWHSEWDEEGAEYLPIGVIDLAVRIGTTWSVFTYTARTSGISQVFHDSRAVWRQFDRILGLSGGLVGLFSGVDHRGVARYPLLPAGRVSIEYDFFDFVLEERDTYWHMDADRWTIAVLAGLERVLQPEIQPSWLKWNEGAVVKLANAVVEGDSRSLPILADALEEAGCENEVVLDLCRRPRTHGGQCWVARLILEKSV
jgi:hypothetical protein